jgi:cysteine sulfinate desulfinase/cysteine desulfurase-like protein
MQEMRRIYLDHNATTPLDPRVRDEMLAVMGGEFGNPSSVHGFGQAARERVEAARDEVAALIGARPPELVFAASGTEANNAVIFSCARRAGWRGHLVISAFEHPSVLAAADFAEAEGMTVTRVPPDRDGLVAAEAMLSAVRDETRLVCLMLANNEIGTLQPVAEVAAGCRDRAVPVLCDAVQAVGKIDVQVGELGVDFLTLGLTSSMVRWGRRLCGFAAASISSRCSLAVARSVGGGRARSICRRWRVLARRLCWRPPNWARELPIPGACETGSRQRCSISAGW